MIAPKHSFLKAFFLANCLGLGVAHAAAVFVPDTQPIGYVGMPEVTSNIVTSGTERMFTIDYNSQNWSGNLHSYLLSSVGGIDDTTDAWIEGAAEQIDLQNVTSGTWNATGRKIVTMNGTGIPFVWGSLSTVQKNAIDLANAANASSPVLNYIRGQRINEAPNGNDYRARSTVMGDIIHSTPVYCNVATCGAATVFVGANDGMLHAINASDGSERFAYIPSMLIPKLKDLTVDPYVHKYFVDGNMDIRKFGTTTILVGALGGGGKGLYALNVTNAAAADETAAASKVLWEATTTTSGYANLGHTYGQPRLATLSGGTSAVIVGNGYNSGVSSLFVINATTGEVLEEIVTASGTGLSSPTVVDTDVDGYVDIAYAGDIDGNLWKFDLVENTSTLLYSQSQAITMAPGVRSHPHGGFMVTFATGRMFTAGTGSDETDASIHAAYGIWDRPAEYADNDTLLEQTLTEADYTAVTPNFKVRTATNNVPDWTPGAGHHKGWKTELPAGERVVGDGAYVTGSIFVFMSTNPTVSTDATPPYENWWMQLNALTGGDNGAIRFDLNNDAAFTSADQLTVDGELVSPVGRHMGGGIRSQLTELNTAGFNVYQANYDKNGDPAVPNEDKGVANGHFDVEIYYDFASKCPTTDGTPGVKAKGSVTFDWKKTKTINEVTIKANGETVYTATNLGSKSDTGLAKVLEGKSSANYTISRDDSKIIISAINAGTAYNGTLSVSINNSTSGYKNKNDLADGADEIAGTGATATCKQQEHIHEWDDIYDKTGVNMLDASATSYDLANAIPSTSTPFKVIAQNQYLSPAVNIHIGNPAYQYDVNAGYIPIKNFTTSATLDVTALPTYTRATVGSLAFNMPVEAFEQRDWWNGALGLPADVRVGLHPTQYECVIASKGSRDGNMFQPVIPPGTLGTLPRADGNGVLGYGTGTTSLTATGVRHNGALAIQVIRADTPQDAIEMSIPEHPEYGYRVKASKFNTYVLAEYSTFWHDKGNAGRCYGTTGWTKLAAPDTRPCGDSESSTTRKCDAPKSSASGTDPKIGAFGGGTGTGGSSGDVVSTEVTENADGTVSVVTTYSDGTTSTTIIDHGISTGGAVNGNGINLGGVTTPPEVLGRVNWRELRQ